MKTPLRYQMSEYDCGPTALLNALSLLFEREEIPPELIRNIMLYSMDGYGADGISGKSGTSRTAMMFVSNWLEGFGRVGRLPVSSRYLTGASVHAGGDGEIRDALRRGGAAVVRLFFEEDHYVTLTGEEDGRLLMFDPYYLAALPRVPGIAAVPDRPFACNRIVEPRVLDAETLAMYALGPVAGREAVLIFNERTKLTPERSIEYFI